MQEAVQQVVHHSILVFRRGGDAERDPQGYGKDRDKVNDVVPASKTNVTDVKA